MVREVAVLAHEESVRLDRETLGTLVRDLGPNGAEIVLARAMEEIAQRLESLAEPHQSGRWAELARRARGLKAIAEQVGMTTLARVAGDVASCATRFEAPALGATLARLDRITYCSLTELWDLQDFGG